MTTPASRAMPATSVRRLALLCAALGAAASPAIAQQQTREFAVVPSVMVTETLTDNARLSRSSAAESDWITQVRPMLRFEATGYRVKGAMDVGVNSSFYGNGSQHDSNQLLLNGNGKLTWWDNHGFLDLMASVSRQPTYAFRPIGGDTVTGASNWSEVRTVSMSPNIKGRFANTGTVEARFTANQSDSSTTVLNRLQTNVWSVSATDPRAFGNLGWSMSLNDSHTSRTNNRDVDHRTFRASALWAVDPQVSLRLIGGTETNNYSTVDNKTTTIYGLGTDWTPTPLTKISGTIEDRFFGTGFNLTAEHRGPQVAFQGSYSKDITTTSQNMTSAVTLLDLAKLYCASEPAATRDACIRRLTLTSTGADASSALIGLQSGLANGFYLDRRLQLGVTFIGRRSSLSVIAFNSNRTTITERDFAVTEDITTTSNLRTTGATVSLQHKMTPITTATGTYTLMRSHTDSTSVGGASDARNRMITAGVSTRLTPRTTGALNVRNSQGGGIASYSENALYGSLLFQF